MPEIQSSLSNESDCEIITLLVSSSSDNLSFEGNSSRSKNARDSVEIGDAYKNKRGEIESVEYLDNSLASDFMNTSQGDYISKNVVKEYVTADVESRAAASQLPDDKLANGIHFEGPGSSNRLLPNNKHLMALVKDYSHPTMHSLNEKLPKFKKKNTKSTNQRKDLFKIPIGINCEVTSDCDSFQGSQTASFHSNLGFGRQRFSFEDSIEEFQLEEQKLFNGYTLAWKDLTCKISSSSRVILDHNTGILYPGSLVAVIGASGCGKTTFLDALANRTELKTSGKVLVNRGIDLQKIIQYCEQEEALLGNLTVWESFYYAAKFKYPKNTSEERIISIVHNALDEFGLSSVQNVLIGTPIRKGCSGGQKRRVSVGTQVLGNEGGILLLDEPTSGLDSNGAFSVIESMKNLVQKYNSTVICSIHQPSVDCFELFTHVVILAQGKQVFFGTRQECFDYFTSIDRPVPSFSNPCDVYLKMTNIDFADDHEAFQKELNYLFDSFRNSQQYATVLENINIFAGASRIFKPFKVRSSDRNGFLYETAVLIRRSFLSAARDPLIYWVRVLIYGALGLLIGSVFYHIPNTQARFIDKITVLCFSVNFLTFMAIAVMPSILETNIVLRREILGRYYSISSFIFANFIVSVPFLMLLALAFSVCCYFLCGYQPYWANFSIYVGFLYLSLLIAEAQVILIGLAVPIMILALATGAVSAAFWMTISGLGIINDSVIPLFWRETFAKINYITFAIKAIINNEFSSLTIDCAKDDRFPNGCLCTIPSTKNAVCQYDGTDLIRKIEKEIAYFDAFLYLVLILIGWKLVTFFYLKAKYWKYLR
jgi:ABC-type multidrug transport system ATPase subunit